MREEPWSKPTEVWNSAPMGNISYLIIIITKTKQINNVVKVAQKQRVDSASGTDLDESSSAPTVCQCVWVCVRTVCARSPLESSVLMILPGFFSPPHLDLVQPSWSGSLPCTTDRGEHILLAPPVRRSLTGVFSEPAVAHLSKLSNFLTADLVRYIIISRYRDRRLNSH